MASSDHGMETLLLSLNDIRDLLRRFSLPSPLGPIQRSAGNKITQENTDAHKSTHSSGPEARRGPSRYPWGRLEPPILENLALVCLVLEVL